MAFTVIVDSNGVPHTVDKGLVSPIPKADIFAAVTEKGIYFVLSNRRAELYNPLEAFGNHNRKSKQYELNTCNRRCYLFYTMYLRSRNRTHFVIARREFQNGQ